MRKNLITLNEQFKRAIASIIVEFNDPSIEGIPSANLIQACYQDAASACLPFVFDRDSLKDLLLIEIDFKNFHGTKLKKMMEVMPWFSAYITEEIYSELSKEDMDVFLEAVVHSMYGAGENNCDIGYYIDPCRVARLAVSIKNNKILTDVINFVVDDFMLDNLRDESLGDKLSLLLAVIGKNPLQEIESDLITTLEKINHIRDEDGDRIYLSDDLIHSLAELNLKNSLTYALNNLDFHPRSPSFYVSLAHDFKHSYSNEQINRLIHDNPVGINQSKAEALLILKLNLKQLDGYELIFQNLNEFSSDHINEISRSVIEEFDEDELPGDYIQPMMSFVEACIHFSNEPEKIMSELSKANWYSQIFEDIKLNKKLKRHLLASELSI